MAKRVLVAPLDWGLGHATRCVPLIRELLRQGAAVILASDGRAYRLLQEEFPDLILEKLPSYNIRYQTDNMIWNMVVQAPKIAWAIWREHWHLQRLIKKYYIDLIISDSRFGCFSRSKKSVFISHQLYILLPNLLLQNIIRRLNRFFLSQFYECWIPDVPGERNLSGKLAHATNFKNLRYIGILSRMQPRTLAVQYDVLVVLSGPEPQRTRLERLILQQMQALPYYFLVVQGKPETEGQDSRTNTSAEGEQTANRGEIVPFLNSNQLNDAMAAAALIVCRSGYSTVMDLAVLGKRAVLVPTPGQTEQEYLAERLCEEKVFYYQKQSELNLAKALQEARHFSGLQWIDYEHSTKILQQTIHHFLQS